MKQLLVLAVLALIHCATAVQVWVDANTGALAFEEPANPGLWPDGRGYCTTSLDAQYMEHTDRYEVWEQIYFPKDYGQEGEISTAINIYDMARCAAAMHERGVWHMNGDCASVTLDFSHQIIKPLLEATRTQERSTLSSRLFGFVLEMRCRGPKDFVVDEMCEEEDKTLCPLIPNIHNCKDANEMMMIAQGRITQIHAIRADAEKRFK